MIPHHRRRGPAKPHYSLKIDFMDAVRGGEKTVIIKGKEHAIKIPAGADSGTHIRYHDFDVSFDVAPHPHFQRDGNDIYSNLEISVSDATLGADVEVETIDQPVKLRIRSGTQPGSLVRLRGKGVLSLRGHGSGDHYVRIIIKIPERLSHEEKRLFEELREV